MTLTPKTQLKFAAAAASLALLSGAAFAGDLSNSGPGGLKDGRGGAVPVPMPVAYEETYKYYLGGGLGWTFNSNGSMSITADHLRPGQAANWIDGYNQLQGPHVISLVAGRYITPSLRAELGIDYRSPQRPAKPSNTYYYDGQVKGTMKVTDNRVGSATLGQLVDSTQTNNYSVQRTEDVSTQNQTFMLNAYYDLNREGRFKPYIGVGIGLSRRDVTRGTVETVTGCSSGSNSVDATATGCQTAALPSYLEAPGAIRSSYEERTGWGLAGSLMAGASYKLTERTSWDLGYRMMYHGGNVSVVNASLGGFSSLNIGARLDHEIRTGLRFDVW
jgi:opacity protein-like surface antigen